ncbi:aminoglycoside phosphotransferase family protein [Shewanella japonica]|uniref:Aminoglycoside phosphotransferase n=1 Tax=Shewanella japonica TaxID=93973 RepID=A0ABN4YIL5_9GAMM|nr:phosphotransferase [Shewanella japonica]ARD21439.1 Aminoglycoside phosphotransferase [Shewanella japonica]
MTLSDTRFILLRKWLSQYFKTEVEIELICGDASFRRYFRVKHLAKSYIVSDSPIELVPIQPFIDMAISYQKVGLVVPEIIAQDNVSGFVLQSDLGDEQLINQLNLQTVKPLYTQALGLLPKIAQVKATASGELPLYDRQFVERELAIFSEWLLGTHLKLTLSDHDKQIISHAFSVLIENAIAQPHVGMHRDYHSRNILLVDKQLGVIDFQDAVIGPVTYDAVSLLRDCYIKWPKDIVDELKQSHFRLCQQHQFIDESVSFEQYESWFDLMGLQRHIKAAGIFARLHHRDAKPGYLKDIPLTLTYIVEVSALYPQLEEFGLWVKERVIPLISK